MSISQDLVKKATEEGKMPPVFLKLGEKITKEDGSSGGVKSTGPHLVRFLSDKAVRGQDPMTKIPRDEIEYLFEENGLKCRYRVSKYKKDPVTKEYTDELNYFVVRMSEVKDDQEIVLEMKKDGKRNFIQFSWPVDSGPKEVIKDEEIPVINEETEEIDVKKIPF